jgi:hypothetical protein
MHSFFQKLSRKIFIFGNNCHSFSNLDPSLRKRKSLKMSDKETIGKLRLICHNFCCLKFVDSKVLLWRKRQRQMNGLGMVSRLRSERQKKNKCKRGRWKQFRVMKTQY